MLQITVPSSERWDEAKEEFVYTDGQTLQLEHSLVSLSKWESKWCKPFLSSKNLSDEEILDYIQCMTVTPNVQPEVYFGLTTENLSQVLQYINAPMTATTFREDNNGKRNREVITAEIIYYSMVAYGIPFECETWHLNRLLTLIRVCKIKNEPPKKRSSKDIMSEYAAINAARRKAHNSKG